LIRTVCHRCNYGNKSNNNRYRNDRHFISFSDFIFLCIVLAKKAKMIAKANIPKMPSVNNSAEESSKNSLATPAPKEIIKATIKPSYVLIAPISSFISSICAKQHSLQHNIKTIVSKCISKTLILFFTF